MPEKMSAELHAALLRFEHWNIESQKIAEGPHGMDGLRSRVAAALIHLSLEHSVAIGLQLVHGFIASAKALYRPQFEAFARGMWLYYCATDKELERFARNVEAIPKSFTDLTDEVNAATNTKIVGAIRETQWKLMNDLTHGGTLQASDRMMSEVMESNYDHTDAVKQLKGTVVIAGLAAAYLMRVTGRENAARRMDTLYDTIFPAEWGGQAVK